MEEKAVYFHEIAFIVFDLISKIDAYHVGKSMECKHSTFITKQRNPMDKRILSGNLFRLMRHILYCIFNI